MMNGSYRPNTFAPREVLVDRRGDGSILLRSPLAYSGDGRTVCDFLPQWANDAGDRIFLAERCADGAWLRLSYAQVWERVGALGEGLLSMGLDQGGRVAILSGNSIDHALIMLAALSIGAVVAPISPNYSLLDPSLARLKDIARVFKPDVVFAKSARGFERALTIDEFSNAKIVLGEPHTLGTTLAELAVNPAGPRFARAFAAIRPEWTAKVLFTSGSTGSPKGVINTHEMLVNVVAMASQLTPSDEPPVQLEWLPWHHTMGGNATFNGIMRSGGTMYIDDGRPVPHLFGKTLANLKDVSPTLMLNVPAGFAMLTDALERDEELCQALFKRLKRITYGGAALPDSVLNKFQSLALKTAGCRIPVVSGYGLTETSPTVCVTHWPSEVSGEIGLPLPGLQLKLQPAGNEFELRVKGQTVTPGYYQLPELTAKMFDEEGYYRTGDLVDFNDRADPSAGLRFVGRLSENFKLLNGTWVNVGEARVALISATDGLAQDIVVAGENEEALFLMVWPKPEPDRQAAWPREKLSGGTELFVEPSLVDRLKELFGRHNAKASASSKIAGFAVLAEPPSLGAGEITDKGYVNQRATINRRVDVLNALKARSHGVSLLQ